MTTRADRVTVSPVAGGPTALQRRDPGQSRSRQCWLVLEFATGTLRVVHGPGLVGDPEPILPDDVVDGPYVGWRVPAMLADDATALMRQLAPLAQRVLAGCTVARGWMVIPNGAAQYASHEIVTEIGELEDALILGYQDPVDYWYDLLDTEIGDVSIYTGLGLAPDATDEDLAQVVDTTVTEALSRRKVVVDRTLALELLRSCRAKIAAAGGVR